MKPGSIIAFSISLFAAAWLVLHVSCGAADGKIAVSLDSAFAGSPETTGFRVFLVDRDPNVVHMHLQAELPGVRHSELLKAYRERMADLGKGGIALDAAGNAEFSPVADGAWWVVTLDPLPFRELRLFWAEPVLVKKGEKPHVRLSLSNTALSLDLNECELN